MENVCFTVRGQAVGKAARVVTRTGRTYLPSRTRDWMSMVQAEAAKVAPDEPWLGAIAVEIDSYRLPPKSLSKRRRDEALGGTRRPTSRPDCDNLSKGICDALSGLVFADDAQVVTLRVAKWFGAREETRIVVWHISAGVA